MKTSRTRCTWRLVGVIAVSLLFTVGCSNEPTLEEAHGFSNLVLDKGMLFFGAGYKLYRVDLSLRSATILYDTNDVLISFAQVDGRRLFFGGHCSPRGGNGMVWSLDLDNMRIVWKHEVKDDWGWDTTDVSGFLLLRLCSG